MHPDVRRDFPFFRQLNHVYERLVALYQRNAVLMNAQYRPQLEDGKSLPNFFKRDLRFEMLKVRFVLARPVALYNKTVVAAECGSTLGCFLLLVAQHVALIG